MCAKLIHHLANPALQNPKHQRILPMPLNARPLKLASGKIEWLEFSREDLIRYPAF